MLGEGGGRQKYNQGEEQRRGPVALLPSGSPFGDPGPHGDLFQFLGPQKVPISFPRSPFSPFEAEERA